MPGTSTIGGAIDHIIGGDPVSAIERAVQGQEWLVLAGVVVAVLVSLAKRLGLLDRLPEGAAKWVSVGLAVAGSVAVSMQTGAPFGRSILHALSVAWMAVGSFETVGRPLRASMVGHATRGLAAAPERPAKGGRRRG